MSSKLARVSPKRPWITCCSIAAVGVAVGSTSVGVGFGGTSVAVGGIVPLVDVAVVALAALASRVGVGESGDIAVAVLHAARKGNRSVHRRHLRSMLRHLYLTT